MTGTSAQDVQRSRRVPRGTRITRLVPVDMRFKYDREMVETIRREAEEFLWSGVAHDSWHPVRLLAEGFGRACRKSGRKGSARTFYRWVNQFLLEGVPWLRFTNDGRRIFVMVTARPPRLKRGS